MYRDETPTCCTVTRKYREKYAQFEQDIEADVVIIGGGFSGIRALDIRNEKALDETIAAGAVDRRGR